ncbi:MAG: MBL fold metallo-hydrolase [Haloarculaceae archaeon]
MPTELRDGVWWLDLGGVNAYLVDDGGTVTLVDAGPPWRAGAVLDGVVEAGFALSSLERVLVTHYDADHVAGLARLGGLDATVYAGRDDAALVAGDARPGWGSLKGASQRLMAPLVGDPAVDVHPVGDGDTVGSFTVYGTPGHTPGHVAFVSERLEAGFLGDLVRESDGDLEPSPWFLSADADRVAESIRDLAGRAPPFEVLGVGHGVPFKRDGKARLDALAQRV